MLPNFCKRVSYVTVVDFVIANNNNIKCEVTYKFSLEFSTQLYPNSDTSVIMLGQKSNNIHSN